MVFAIDKKTDPKAYQSAREKCKSKSGKAKSRCTRFEYLKQCQANRGGAESSACLDVGKKSRLLDTYKEQKWVYLRPYLSGREIACGTKASRKGHACRPTVTVPGARAKTILELLRDKSWLSAWPGSSNCRKLNRMAAYKDARGPGIIMYWSTGKFYDKEKAQMNEFRALYELTEKQFRKLLRKHDKDVAREFQDINSVKGSCVAETKSVSKASPKPPASKSKSTPSSRKE